MSKLTKRQNEILALIQAHMDATGSPPTRAEIAKKMGFRSPNAAEDHLRALARKGAIELVPGTSRGIRLPQGIPIIDNVKGKAALLSAEHIIGNSPIPRNLFRPTVDFLFHLTKSDYQALGFQPHDYLAIHSQESATPGQIVLLRTNSDISFRRYSNELKSQPHVIEGIVVGLIRNLNANDTR